MNHQWCLVATTATYQKLAFRLEEIILTGWDNNDKEEDDDSNNNADAHLHVLPPHLFPNPIGPPPKPLGRDCEIVGLILE